MSDQNPVCPFCEKTVNVEDIVTHLIKGSKNTGKGSVVDRFLSTQTKFITVVYSCPHCSKILGFSN